MAGIIAGGLPSFFLSWLVSNPVPPVPLEQHIRWGGLDPKTVMKWAFAWELIYKSSHRLINSQVSDANAKMKRFGSSYVTAFLNAVVCTSLGVINLSWLLGAPEQRRYVMATETYDPWYNDTQSVRYSAYAFLGWILCDLIHVLLNFGPKKLGGWDTVAHHTLFAALVGSCIGYGTCPFAAAWLFCGELSTLPLNVRFLLINTGRGATAAMDATNKLFAASFFLVRVALYWWGLFDFLRHGPAQLLAHGAPGVLVAGVTTALVLGGALNFFWFTQIVKMAMGGPRKPEKGPATNGGQKQE